MKNILIILMTGTMFSCYTGSPNGYSAYSQPNNQNDLIKKSLFNAKDRTISEEDIQRLLDGEIKLPDSARIAIYNFGTTSLNRYYAGYRYNEEFLKLKQNYIDKLTSTIDRSARVKKVVLMPNIMTDQNPTLTNLRESAVRLQADLLIIFSIKSDIYYKYKVFKKDQAKAFATLETLLFDIRTGIVPYSSIVTKEQLVSKEESDADIKETQKRAENEAILSALTASGDQLVKFLNEQNE